MGWSFPASRDGACNAQSAWLDGNCLDCVVGKGVRPDVLSVPEALLGRQPLNGCAERPGFERLPARGIEQGYALVTAVERVAQQTSGWGRAGGSGRGGGGRGFDKPVWPSSIFRYGPPVWLSMFTGAGSAAGLKYARNLL